LFSYEDYTEVHGQQNIIIYYKIEQKYQTLYLKTNEHLRLLCLIASSWLPFVAVNDNSNR